MVNKMPPWTVTQITYCPNIDRRVFIFCDVTSHSFIHYFGKENRPIM